MLTAYVYWVISATYVPSWIYHTDRVPALGDCLWSRTCRSNLMHFLIYIGNGIYTAFGILCSVQRATVSVLFPLISFCSPFMVQLLANTAIRHYPHPRASLRRMTQWIVQHLELLRLICLRNSVWHCTRRCCRFGQTWNGHDWTVHYFLFYVSSFWNYCRSKISSITFFNKDFLHYVL
jgi:hypothetical protein